MSKNESKTSHRLRSLEIIGGFLDGQKSGLAGGLNCILGARWFEPGGVLRQHTEDSHRAQRRSGGHKAPRSRKGMNYPGNRSRPWE